MYIYKLEAGHYDTTSKEEVVPYDQRMRNDKHYTSRTKAIEVLEKRQARRINKNNFSVLKEEGDYNLRDADYYEVHLIEPDDIFEQYGFYTVTVMRVTKLEVE